MATDRRSWVGMSKQGSGRRRCRQYVLQLARTLWQAAQSRLEKQPSLAYMAGSTMSSPLRPAYGVPSDRIMGGNEDTGQ